MIQKVVFIYLQFRSKEPLLPGASDLDQLVKIFDVFGTPNETNWPVQSNLNTFILKINFKSLQQTKECKITAGLC